MITLGPTLTPHGRLLLAPVDDAPGLPPDLARTIEESFARGSGHGILQLGAGEAGRPRSLQPRREQERPRWLKTMVDAGEIYHPLRWSPAEAFQLLTDLPLLESAGIVVRVPGTWRAHRPSRPQVSATVGGKTPSGLGADALLDFQMEVTLDGERLTAAEIKTLLASSDGLHFIRGRSAEFGIENQEFGIRTRIPAGCAFQIPNS
jgi:hypothetical protein